MQRKQKGPAMEKKRHVWTRASAARGLRSVHELSPKVGRGDTEDTEGLCVVNSKVELKAKVS